LWRDQLHVELFPDRVNLARLSRGWQQQEISRKTLPCGEPEAGEAAWEAGLRVLQAEVPAMGGGRMDAVVVLSNHFVRYALIPWSDQVSNDSEEQAYVRHCFSVTYNDDADNLVMRVSPNGYGAMQVASAVDQRLLDGLERVAGVCNLRLNSVQPHLMSVFNQWRRRLSGPMVWFVLAEQDKLCISLLKHGHWCSLRTMKSDNAWLTKLPNLLERELRLSDNGTERGKVFLFAPEVAKNVAFPVSDWAVNWLEADPGQGTPLVKNWIGIDLKDG